VTDPLNSSNHALSFSGLNYGGDAFTNIGFSLNAGVTYTVSFDYLGAPGALGYGAITPSSNTVSNNYYWVFDHNDIGSYVPQHVTLVSDGAWHSYSLNFTAADYGTTVYLAFEQAPGGNNTSGTAYFDNVRLSAVPLPGALLLLGPGLTGLVAVRRRFKG